MKKIILSTIMLALCLISCKRIEVNSGDDAVQMGSLSFAVTDLTDYITVETKAGIDYTDYNNYDVVIEGPTPVSGKYGEMFVGNVVELGSGTYSITVTSPATEPAAFEQPIYRAYEEFEIKAGEVTDLKLTCTPYNCKVTIELSDNFKKELASYEVVVTNGLGELVWSKNAEKDDFAEEKAGYFLARGLEVKVKGYRSIDNTEATAVYFVKDPQPAEHHIVKLDAKVTGEIGGIQIEVSTKFNEKSDEIYVDGMDESYVDRPDFDGSEGGDEEEVIKNEIIWEANKTFADYVIDAESQINMVISMPLGIGSFVVEVDHEGFQNALTLFTGDLDGDGNKEKYIDLINDTVFATQIRNVPGGDTLPVGDRIENQTNITFDLTCFVPLLVDTAPGETVPFILKAADVQGNELKVMGDYPTITLVIPSK